jgi:3-oxoacid CoA-transferase subunit B
LPLTGVNCITRIITDLAVLEVKDNAFHLRERAPGVGIEEIIEKTAGKLVVEGDIPEMLIN